MKLSEEKLSLVIDAFDNGTPRTLESVKEILMLKQDARAQEYLETARSRMKDPLFDVEGLVTEETSPNDVSEDQKTVGGSHDIVTDTTAKEDFDPFEGKTLPNLDTYDFYIRDVFGKLSELEFQTQSGSRLILEYPRPKEIPVEELPDDALHPTLGLTMGELRKAVGVA